MRHPDLKRLAALWHEVYLFVFLLLPSSVVAADRTFDFTYAAKLTSLPAGAPAHIWLPIPSDDQDQKVQIISQEVPADFTISIEPKCHNRILYFKALPDKNNSLALSITYRITRREVVERPDPAADAELDKFLQPDALVPLGGKPETLLAHQRLPTDSLALARDLYNTVDDHMQYRKDKPGWGHGDACWATDSGFGNCTDFHSLFISLARTQHLPCKFEIGFSVPADRQGTVAGYHCWAFVKPTGHNWIPIDISEANKHPDRRDYYFGHLDPNRVTFSTGRDLILAPPQQGEPINFFVYPYAESDGHPISAERIQMQCTFKDQP